MFVPLTAAAQLTVGVERPIANPDPETLLRTGRVAVASAFETILAVWVDGRTDRGTELVAARLDRLGGLRDPIGIPLTATPDMSEDHPLLRYINGRFVLVWSAGGNTLAAEINANGTYISGPKVLGPGIPTAIFPTDREFAVVIDNPTESILYLVRGNYTLVEIKRFTRRHDVKAARLGTGLVAAFTEIDFPATTSRITAARIANSGLTIEQAPLTQLGTFGRVPTLVVEQVGQDAIIAAADSDRIAVVRMRPDGTVVTLHVDESDARRSLEQIVTRTDGFDLIAIVNDRARVFRFTDNALTSENAPIGGNARDGAGTISTGRVYTTWNIDGTVIGRYAYAGPQEFPTTISRSAPSQQLPALASNGAIVLAAWIEDIDDTRSRVMARILGTEGTPDATVAPVTVASRQMTPRGSAPAVTFSGGNYQVAWLDQRRGPDRQSQLLLKSVTPRGVLGAEIAISGGATATSPALASDGSDALLVWTEQLLDTSGVRATLVSRPQSDFAIPETIDQPAVVYGNGAYVVVGTTALGNIRGTLVSRAGAIQRTLFETAGGTDSDPAIAWNGSSHYLVVFLRESSVYGRLLDRDGNTVGDNFLIGIGGDNPAVTWDGHAFVAAWTVRDENLDGDVYAARVTITDAVETPVVISATVRNDYFPTFAGTLMAYHRMTAELNNVHRIFTRVVAGPPLVAEPTKRRSVRK